MAFWSKQSTTKREPVPAPAQFSAEFDHRFGIRYQEAKDLAAEMEEVNAYHLDWDGLDLLEAYAHRVIQLDREFFLDLKDEVQTNRRLLESHPSVPSMFKKFVRQAEQSLRQVDVHRARLRREGRKRAVLSIEPYPIRNPNGVVIYDVFGSLLFHSRQPTLKMAIAQAKIDTRKWVEEYQRTHVISEDRGESVDFRHAFLPGIDLSGIELEGEDFRGANLANANFAGSTLNECVFSDCDLTRANFIGCGLSNSQFDNAMLEFTNFHGAKLESADFSFANIHNANMADTDLSWAHFFRAYIVGVDFQGSIVANATFDQADVIGCISSNVKYGQTSFRNTGFDFTTMNLQGNDLTALLSAIGLPSTG